MQHNFIIYRQDNITPSNFVLIKANTTNHILTTSHLLAAFKEGVTQWAKTTFSGRTLYNYTLSDMNIGDIISHAIPLEQIISFCPNIRHMQLFSIPHAAAPDDWNYDSSICSPIKPNQFQKPPLNK